VGEVMVTGATGGIGRAVVMALMGEILSTPQRSIDAAGVHRLSQRTHSWSMSRCQRGWNW
jgi:uncharacterized protein YbjT (DUF2867 family)